jgi:hypothetical protein
LSKQKTAAELRAEVRFLKRSRANEGFVSIVNNLIRWGGLVMISYFGFLSAGALAGHHTFADIGIRVLADVRVSEAVAWIFGGSGVAYGMRQRKLRRDTVERLANRNIELEKRLDPNRTSSQLTPRGDTRPEDTDS